MGLFDELKKIGKEIATNIQNAQSQSSSNSSSTYVENTVVPVPDKVVPAEYSNFPEFGKTPLRMTTTKAANYIRCSMVIENIPQEEFANYISKINSLGYVKGSNVRYDKLNTYIIADYRPNSGRLYLAFHIKN